MGITLDSIKAKMLGKTFGKLTVLEYAGRSERGDNLWKCRCECGTEVVKRTSNVDKDTSACAACSRTVSPKYMKQRTQLLNQKFGRLTVVECAGENRFQQILWRCVCDCGNEIRTRTGNLTAGVTQSCGCYGRERASQANTDHGLHDHPLYAVWSQMKDRCYNENNERYHRYGGRGIRVCDQWMDFSIFYNWAMLHGYERGLTIERTDNDGNYDPGNCRWATLQEQVQNTSRTKMSPELVQQIREDPRTNMVIAKELGVDESTITRIKNRVTWSNV